jgi:AcrR family transcriptional regulator
MVKQTSVGQRDTGARERILQAAVKVLAEQGFEAASTKEIARAASVAGGLVHYYFPTKEDLLMAVARHASDQHVLEMSSIRSHAKPETIGKAALTHTRKRIEERPELYRLRHELFALGLRNKALRKEVADLLRTGRYWIGETLEKVKPRPAKEREALAAISLAVFDGLALQSMIDPGLDLGAAFAAFEELMTQA